jgi:hypothetical protein
MVVREGGSEQAILLTVIAAALVVGGLAEREKSDFRTMSGGRILTLSARHLFALILIAIVSAGATSTCSAELKPQVQLSLMWEGERPSYNGVEYDAVAGSSNKLNVHIDNLGPGSVILDRMQAYLDTNLDGVWELMAEEAVNYPLKEHEAAIWKFDLAIPSNIKAPYWWNVTAVGLGDTKLAIQCEYSATSDGQNYTERGEFDFVILGAQVQQTTTSERTAGGATPELVLFSMVAVVIAASVVVVYVVKRTTRPTRAFCVQCGAENPSTCQYCGKCGTKLQAT